MEVLGVGRRCRGGSSSRVSGEIRVLGGLRHHYSSQLAGRSSARQQLPEAGQWDVKLKAAPLQGGAVCRADKNSPLKQSESS